jgi:hypothetical protein
MHAQSCFLIDFLSILKDAIGRIARAASAGIRGGGQVGCDAIRQMMSAIVLDILDWFCKLPL